MPYELVAADGPDERRWKPVGGLGIEDWPYLKACCCPWDDENFAQILRDEIIGAILISHLQKKGCSFGVATTAVDYLANKADLPGRGPFWEVVDKLPFEDVIAALYKEASRIREELQEFRRRHAEESKRQPDGPKGKKMFCWRGEPYLLPPREFKLVSVLWAAPDRSLPVSEVLKKVWGDRTEGKEEIHNLNQRASNAGILLDGTGIRISLGKDRLGYHRVSLELP
jgi:hypothetical protein